MEPPSYQFVKVELLAAGHVAIIKLNRPNSGNSCHPTLVSEWSSALEWIEQQPDIRVVIQTGEGKFYCTGMELVDSGPVPALPFARGSVFDSLCRTLICTEKILIAAVNGPAAGFGVSSLGLFDLVYSVPDAYFFTPFVKWGMTTEGASSYSFTKLMGHQKAALLFLAGDRVSAEEAERLGLVSKILPGAGFLDHVQAIARRISQSPPGALRATKRLMKHQHREELLAAHERECDVMQNERYGSEESRQALKQFQIEKEQKRKLKSNL
ncbi:ClpP/crotonase [Aaosphaeria arxii CBS 175.79]|uniref:ClpP/crotonase n=1 Tax=Aaosphaeria arxii CBS 175.79 TaxID=1450172 RepID=A0A6A5XY81_9PLEO|nr:ClpP/crotonase [Aaosphaeria arxii CBS 175.79]KAF2017883.1 ClpP/crotonase [Aaosphaeria arxii CBS 175.79]